MRFFVCLLLIASVHAAENDGVAHHAKSNEWIVLAGNETITKIVTKNSVTNEFIGWLVSNNRMRGIISLLLDDNQNITGVTWNICDYADETMIMQLSRISSLKSSEIVISKNSLPEEALERIRKANPKVSYSRKLHTGESSSLIIEQVAAPNP